MVIGGFFRIGEALSSFIVDKKKKKNKMAITVERFATLGSPIGNSLVKAAAYQGAKNFVFAFPLRCTSCQPRLKEARYQRCQFIRINATSYPNQIHCPFRIHKSQ